MSKKSVKFSKREQIEEMIKHPDKDMLWYMRKLNISESTYFRRKVDIKKLAFDTKIDIPDVEEKYGGDETDVEISEFDAYPISDNITLAYVEQKALRVRTKNDIEICKLLLDILYKRDKIKSAQAESEEDIGDYEIGKDPVEAILLKD